MTEHKITNIDELLGLLKRDSNYKKIKLEFDKISVDNPEDLERKINKYYNSCGCDTGSIFLLIALVSYTLYMFLREGSLGRIIWLDILYGFIFTIICAIIGKFIGIGLDRIKLKRCINDVKHSTGNNINTR